MSNSACGPGSYLRGLISSRPYTPDQTSLPAVPHLLDSGPATYNCSSSLAWILGSFTLAQDSSYSSPLPPTSRLCSFPRWLQLPGTMWVSACSAPSCILSLHLKSDNRSQVWTLRSLWAGPTAIYPSSCQVGWLPSVGSPGQVCDGESCLTSDPASHICVYHLSPQVGIQWDKGSVCPRVLEEQTETFVVEAPFGTHAALALPAICPHPPSYFILIPVLLPTVQLPMADIFWGSASEFLVLPGVGESLSSCGHRPSAGGWSPPSSQSVGRRDNSGWPPEGCVTVSADQTSSIR